VEASFEEVVPFVADVVDDKYSLLLILLLGVKLDEEILAIFVVAEVEVGTGVRIELSEVVGTSGTRGAKGTPHVELNTVFCDTIELLEDDPTDRALLRRPLVGGSPVHPGGRMWLSEIDLE